MYTASPIKTKPRSDSASHPSSCRLPFSVRIIPSGRYSQKNNVTANSTHAARRCFVHVKNRKFFRALLPPRGAVQQQPERQGHSRQQYTDHPPGPTRRPQPVAPERRAPCRGRQQHHTGYPLQPLPLFLPLVPPGQVFRESCHDRHHLFLRLFSSITQNRPLCPVSRCKKTAPAALRLAGAVAYTVVTSGGVVQLTAGDQRQPEPCRPRCSRT